MRLRSALLASAAEGLAEALASEADALVFPTPRDDHDRESVAAAVTRAGEAGRRCLALVNHPRTRVLRNDLEAIVRPGLAGVLLPHATGPQDLRDLAVLLREFELSRDIEPGSVQALAVIDTARGLLRAPEIASAVPRMAALVFASGAYARDIEARPDDQGFRLAHARGAVVAAARSHGLLPLAWSSALELRDLAQQGFSGAVVEDAPAITAANSWFMPSPDRVERARGALAAYAAARAEGAWVARLEDGLVDAAAARAARQILEQAGESVPAQT